MISDNLSNMDIFKHSFNKKSKHRLLPSEIDFAYDKAMLKQNKKPPSPEQLELGKRVKEAILSLGKRKKTFVANACNVSDQAVTGWEKTGRVGKDKLKIIADITGYNLDWLISGRGQKLTTSARYDTVKAITNFIVVDSVNPSEIGQYLISHDQITEVEKMLLIDDGELGVKQGDRVFSYRVESSREESRPHYFIFNRDQKDFTHEDIVLVSFGDDETYHIMRYLKFGDIARFESELNARQHIEITDGLRFTVHAVCAHIQPIGRKPRAAH